MTKFQYFKAWLIVLLIFTISWITAIKLSSQVGPAPTLQNCNCIVAKAFKQTDNTLTIGHVTVYSNQVTFKFKSTTKTFFKRSTELWEDEKGSYWLFITTANGDKVLKNKDVLYFFNEKIE